MTLSVPLFFTKLTPAQLHYVKNSYTEFHENPTDGLAADNTSHADGSTEGREGGGDPYLRRSLYTS